MMAIKHKRGTHHRDDSCCVDNLSDSTFNMIREIIYDRSGITLGENKQALVRARIAKRMRHLQIPGYSDYIDHVVNDASGGEIQHLVDAISTNVTSFYREPSHFDLMRKVIDEWIKSGIKSIRLWSAASSTGEEPYTMAIELLETIYNRRLDAKILATDISSRVLEICLRGEYTEDKIAPVPQPLRNKYFTKKKDNAKAIYSVNDSLRNLVIFRQFNLSSPPFPIRGPLDMIFCRNVMIYFDKKVRTSMVGEFLRLLKPGGYLMVGHAESITGLSSEFKCIKPSIYLRE